MLRKWFGPDAKVRPLIQFIIPVRENRISEELFGVCSQSHFPKDCGGGNVFARKTSSETRRS